MCDGWLVVFPFFLVHVCLILTVLGKWIGSWWYKCCLQWSQIVMCSVRGWKEIYWIWSVFLGFFVGFSFWQRLHNWTFLVFLWFFQQTRRSLKISLLLNPLVVAGAGSGWVFRWVLLPGRGSNYSAGKSHPSDVGLCSKDAARWGVQLSWLLVTGKSGLKWTYWSLLTFIGLAL